MQLLATNCRLGCVVVILSLVCNELSLSHFVRRVRNMAQDTVNGDHVVRQCEGVAVEDDSRFPAANSLNAANWNAYK
jgi:hypothetical protein